MKMTMEENNAFLNFYNIIKTEKQLPLKTAFRLTQIAKKANEYSEFYRERFTEIINQYAQKDTNGNIIQTADNAGVQLREGAQEEAIRALTELNTLEVDLPDIKFHLEDFEKVGLSPENIELIMPFLDIE